MEPNWTEEAFSNKPKLVILFDRLARIGRAMQRARAKVAQSAHEQDNVPAKQNCKQIEEK